MQVEMASCWQWPMTLGKATLLVVRPAMMRMSGSLLLPLYL
ncbi:hypothetical protein X748_20755 [Mesorhizobium sp. LNJC386A00]|nr:hypothetical protein X752_00400 [Mesorhizobium sp. LNJC398B00]ESY34119.1 hypothetical protein X748_20755 [Mesorhizobium sp. LNJC386A00]